MPALLARVHEEDDEPACIIITKKYRNLAPLVQEIMSDLCSMRCRVQSGRGDFDKRKKVRVLVLAWVDRLYSIQKQSFKNVVGSTMGILLLCPL